MSKRTEKKLKHLGFKTVVLRSGEVQYVQLDPNIPDMPKPKKPKVLIDKKIKLDFNG